MKSLLMLVNSPPFNLSQAQLLMRVPNLKRIPSSNFWCGAYRARPPHERCSQVAGLVLQINGQEPTRRLDCSRWGRFRVSLVPALCKDDCAHAGLIAGLGSVLLTVSCISTTPSNISSTSEKKTTAAAQEFAQKWGCGKINPPMSLHQAVFTPLPCEG
jgi:hypothetical protein